MKFCGGQVTPVMCMAYHSHVNISVYTHTGVTPTTPHTAMWITTTKGGLGRVRNNIHKVLYCVVRDLHHTRV